MKLPFEFSLKLVFRLVLPGFLLSLGLYPLVDEVIHVLKVHATPEVVLTMSTVVLGWFFVVLDMPIYMAFEGRRYWPDWLWRGLHAMEVKRLESLEREVADFQNSEPRKYLEASVEVRRFPIDPDNETRRAEYPTRLGNLLAAHETYSKLIYGMDAVFYWPRIWVELDKDLREEIDNQQALADSTTYVAAALSVCGVLAVLYAGMGVLSIPALDWLPNPLASALLGATSLVAARVFYRLSLHAHAQFGELFKAVFDIYRNKISVDDIVKEVAEIAGVDPSKLPAKQRFEVTWRYLHNYRIMTRSGEVLTPRQARQARFPKA